MKQYEKAAIEQLNRVYWEEARSLYDVYAKPNKEKCDAWQDIIDRAIACNGIATIVGHNSHVFTAAIFWFDCALGLPYGMYIFNKYRVTVNMANNAIVESIKEVN